MIGGKKYSSSILVQLDSTVVSPRETPFVQNFANRSIPKSRERERERERDIVPDGFFLH